MAGAQRVGDLTFGQFVREDMRGQIPKADIVRIEIDSLKDLVLMGIVRANPGEVPFADRFVPDGKYLGMIIGSSGEDLVGIRLKAIHEFLPRSRILGSSGEELFDAAVELRIRVAVANFQPDEAVQRSVISFLHVREELELFVTICSGDWQA